jgi:1-acyl-sn-glycerol-3-phosphate acyltransferase
MNSISHDHATYQTIPTPVSFMRRLLPSVIFYAGYISVVFRSSIMARKGRYGDRDWMASSIEILRLLEKIGLQFEIDGLENLAADDGPVIIIGNHVSTLETLILPGLVVPYKPTTFVVKQSLLEYPVFKHVMRSRNPIAVTRTNPRLDLKTVLEEGQERLSRGISIIIFPQTTRASDFNPKQFSSIGIKLAKKAGVPIIPLALMTDAWSNGTLLKDFGKIDPSKKAYFSFGTSIQIQGKGTQEHQQVIDFIESRLKSW